MCVLHCNIADTNFCLLMQGMESYCIRAFAEALEVIPYTLAENAGLNPIEMVTELRNRHAQGDTAAGINVRKGQVTNMLEENVVQPLLVTTSAVTLACECVRMILKVSRHSNTQTRLACYTYNQWLPSSACDTRLSKKGCARTSTTYLISCTFGTTIHAKVQHAWQILIRVTMQRFLMVACPCRLMTLCQPGNVESSSPFESLGEPGQ